MVIFLGVLSNRNGILKQKWDLREMFTNRNGDCGGFSPTQWHFIGNFMAFLSTDMVI